MRAFVVVAIVALLILHQDNWLWDDQRLVFGFLPIGLAYHALISVLATTVWFLVMVFCWPDKLDQAGAESGTAEPGA